MSFGRDVRSIARTKEIEEKADRALKTALDAQDKAAINGIRMIAWIAAGGGTTAVKGTEKGIPGLDALSQAAVDAAAEELEDNIDTEQDARVYNLGTDASNLATTQGSSTRTAKSLLDDESKNNASGTQVRSDIVPSEKGESSASKITSVSVQDPLTNSTVLLNIIARSANASAVYYRLPQGWADEDTPPDYPGWELGYYWTQSPPFASAPGSPTGLQKYYTLEEAKADLISMWSYGGDTRNPANIVGQTIVQPSPDPDLIRADVRVQDPTGIYTMPIGRAKCIDNPDALFCPATAPNPENFWPTIGNGILAWIDGKWTPNQYDSEIPPIYQTPQSVVRFAMGDGRFGIMKPARSGGHVLYELDGSYTTDTIKPGSFGLVFRADGTLEKFVPESEIPRHFLNL